MINLFGDINELTAEFRARVEELLENAEVELTNLSHETLARWISEELSKCLVEYNAEGEEDDYINPDEEYDKSYEPEYEDGPPFPRA